MPSSERPSIAVRCRAAPARPEQPLEAREGEVLVWTDGACRATPAPAAGRRSSSRPDGASRSSSRAATPHTTNNRMEYTAALEGLRSLPAGSRACIVTDSRLMLDSMTKWIHGWKRKGWKTAGGDPVKNQDLVRALDAEIARHAAVRWHWVRGHETGAEHAHKALNDRADRLAVAAAAVARSAA